MTKNISLSSGFVLKLSGMKLLMAVYFLAYGVFGYGSGFTITDFATLLPMLSGLVLGAIYFMSIKAGVRDWHLSIRLTFWKLAVFTFILLFLTIIHRDRLGDELINDELSYLQLAHAHSLEILNFAPEGLGPYESQPLIRLTSTLVIAAIGILLWWGIFRQSIIRAILFTFISTFLLQMAFALVGGWGWGYTKIAWLPHLIGTSILGLSPFGFRLSSLAIVALGLTILVFTLRRFGLRTEFSILVVASMATLPLPTIFQPSIDHVLFFVLFAIPALGYLVFRPTQDQLDWLLTILCIGVTFRITVAFVLVAVLIGGLLNRRLSREKVGIFRLLIPVGILSPYLIGTLIRPAVGVGSAYSSPQDGSEATFESWLRFFDNQLGIVAFIILALGLIVGALQGHQVIPSVAFIFIAVYFYFVSLSNSGLVGEPKYAIEWVTSFALLGLLWWGLILREFRSESSLSLLLVPSLLLSSNVFLPALSPEVRQMLTQTKLSQAPLGYASALASLRQNDSCQPVGIVYGAGSEISHNKSWKTVFEVRKLHSKLQSQIAIKGRDWGKAYSDIADEEGATCLYGTRDSFYEIAENRWQGWYLYFLSDNGKSKSPVIVMKKSEK
jgi:hypothetical protein